GGARARRRAGRGSGTGGWRAGQPRPRIRQAGRGRADPDRGGHEGTGRRRGAARRDRLRRDEGLRGRLRPPLARCMGRGGDQGLRAGRNRRGDEARGRAGSAPHPVAGGTPALLADLGHGPGGTGADLPVSGLESPRGSHRPHAGERRLPRPRPPRSDRGQDEERRPDLQRVVAPVVGQRPAGDAIPPGRAAGRPGGNPRRRARADARAGQKPQLRIAKQMVVNERLRASIDVAPRTAAFYEHVISALEEEGVPFMLGGAFAFEVYTDIGGRTKDLDLFLHPRDVKAAMAALNRRGYDTEMKARHWLGKIKSGDDFVDVIFGSGNGLAVVDDVWCEHARPAEGLAHA